jgi:hypothetical protein
MTNKKNIFGYFHFKNFMKNTQNTSKISIKLVKFFNKNENKFIRWNKI